jgi:hypothetical protein
MSDFLDSLDELRDAWQEASRAEQEKFKEIWETVDYETRLAITATVMKRIVEHATEGGTYRYLIYDRLELGMDAYAVIMEAGGMTISNEFDLERMSKIKEIVKTEKLVPLKKILSMCDHDDCYNTACLYDGKGNMWCHEHMEGK